MRIQLDDLTGPEIAAFLDEHIQEMKPLSPPESKHALDLDGLRKPEITFWTVWEDTVGNSGVLVGCGAIKELDAEHGEIKSLRTAAAYRGQGVASMLLRHILDVALSRSYKRLSLETGSMAYFDPARRLYEKFGFVVCGPFAEYKLDPYSVFMTKEL